MPAVPVGIEDEVVVIRLVLPPGREDAGRWRMSFRDEPVPHPQVDERQPGDRWQNLSDAHAVVMGPFEHRHRSPDTGQSDGRCGSGWTSPDYGDIKPLAHERYMPGWRPGEVVSSCTAGTISTTISSLIANRESAHPRRICPCPLLSRRTLAATN